MDFQYLLDIVLRRKWLVVLAGLIPAIATFVYFSMQDRSYKSDSLVSTGIIGSGGLNLEEDRPYLQDMLVGINFGTRLEKLKGPSMKRLLAYQMLLHDLSGKKEPFRTIKYTEELEFSEADIPPLLKEMQLRLDSLNTRVLPRNLEKPFKEISKELEYDFKSFDDEIIVYRRGDTDAIAAEYESEDPYLSAYLVNQLIQIYIRLSEYEQDRKYIEDFQFAEDQANQKRAVLDTAKNNLNFYRENRTVLDLDVQSQKLVERIVDLEEQMEKERATVKTAENSISEIDVILQQQKEGQKNKELNKILDSEEIVKYKDKVSELRQKYIETRDKTYKEQADLAERQLNLLLEREVKRDAFTEKDYTKDLSKNLEEVQIDWRLQKIEAENRLNSIVAELGILRGRRGGLVTDQNQMTRLQSAYDLANEEYQDAKNRLNAAKTSLEKSYHPLSVVEHAQVADKAESSGRVMFTLFSGVLGSGFCTALLLLLAFFDMSLNNPHQFSKFTDLPLVGTLNEIQGKNVDLNNIFSSNGKNEGLLAFKESVRSIRYSMEESDANTFLFTSTDDNAGKTFLMITLAYAMTLKQKKVLLIDTNFKNNTLTQMSETAQRNNLLATKLIGENNLEEDFEYKSGIGNKFSIDHVDIIGNRGGYNSPGEIFAGKDFHQFVKDLSKSYDYIFLEGAALNKYSDTKELIGFADKVIAVFAADSTIDDADRKSIQFLKELDNKLLGAILNKLDLANLS